MSVPDINCVGKELDKWMTANKDELLSEYDKQQEKEREVFGDWESSSMRLSPLNRCEVALSDRRAKIRNVAAATPDQAGSTDVGDDVFLEERFLTFLTNKGNTRSLEENSTSNQLSNLDELLYNLKGQKKYLERLLVHEEEASRLKLAIDRMNNNPTVLQEDKVAFKKSAELSIDKESSLRGKRTRWITRIEE